MSAKILIAFIISAIAIIVGLIDFFKTPDTTRIDNVKEWLKWAVVEAEKALGSGTGQLKLRYVYNMAISQFPWIAQIVSFETFSSWVDEALEWMRKQLADNSATQSYVDADK